MSDYALESLAGAFAGSIDFHWDSINHERPIAMASRFDAINSDLNDLLPPMVGARQILVDQVQQNFDTESDPDGSPWAPWSESYQKRPPTSSQILRDTDELHDAATDPNNYPVIDEGEGESLWVNTSNFPPYWSIHQTGGTAGRGAQLPARPYIGLSEETAFEVIDVFDDYLTQTVEFRLSGSGRLHTIQKGRFGGIVGSGYTRQTRMMPTDVSGIESGFGNSDEMLP